MLTVACQDKELVIITEIVDGDVGESSNNLLLGWEVGALLELKVSNST